MKFEFFAPTRIVHHEGSAQHITKYARLLGISRILLVTDTVLRNNQIVHEMVRALGSLCAGVFDEVIPDSGFGLIARGTKKGKEIKADGVVSVGGGSTIDSAKCIAALLGKGRDDISEFLGFGKIGKPVLPHVAVPTTAGTGSEVTSYAVVKSDGGKAKHIIADTNIMPDLAILDPRMTISLPRALTASTGADALTHAVESLYALRHGPISDGLALHAINLIIAYLPVCVKEGSNLEARSMVLSASCMAGIAFENALVGVVHALAHAVGGMYGVPHGIATGIFLPCGLEFNAETSGFSFSRIASALGIETKGDLPTRRISGMLIDFLEKFLGDLGLPRRLSEVGVKEEGLEACAELAFRDPAMRSNPRKIDSSSALLEILRRTL